LLEEVELLDGLFGRELVRAEDQLVVIRLEERLPEVGISGQGVLAQAAGEFAVDAVVLIEQSRNLMMEVVKSKTYA
jgi:hypothetical protein